jgi:SAM-dependent methyltransferase
MQDLKAERQFYQDLFTEKPDNEHITFGYDELYNFAFPEPPQGLLLDLGCGTGAHTIRLARRGYQVVGAELTLAGAQSAQKRLRDEGFNPMVVVADAEHTPFRDGAFHTVWAALLLHHFPVLDVLPKEIRRVTRKRVVLFEPNSGNFLTWFAFNIVNPIWGLKTTTKNQRSLNPGKLQRMFEGLGFQRFSLRFADRGWNDRTGSLLRRTYRGITSVLPEKFRANKFLLTGELPAK